MPTTLSIRASDPGSGSRAFHWPVLESGNGSFEGGVYSVTCEDRERGRSFFLLHEVHGAPLIEMWMQANMLLFVCTVASPRSMYRALHKSQNPRQSIQWNQKDLGDFPTFSPMIVAGQEIRHVIDAQADGLARAWHRKEVRLPRGARVAVGPAFRFQSGITGLFDFELEPSLEDGRFYIKPSTEDGFKFKVQLASNLYKYLRYQRREPAGTNVMVHVVSAALACLRQDYRNDDGEEGWQSFPNLIELGELLGRKKLRHWTDEDFRPEVVATGLHPHRVPLVSVAEDDQR